MMYTYIDNALIYESANSSKVILKKLETKMMDLLDTEDGGK